ncbi:hypothetical protein WJX73_001021 [Symbiochloris irregularis]|uniref:Uncharacterized protein n=1 Tax=Symbiochloris irregularis TaxID=706552 RepID=A0AAW1NRF3_9CHLO
MSGTSGQQQQSNSAAPHPDAVPVQNADGTQGWMISDAVAAALRPVGLHEFVPGRSVNPETGEATNEADDHAHQSSGDTQANAEGAAGRAFNKVGQAVGNGSGVQGSAEGMSENVTKQADEPAHANAGSANVVKPHSGRQAYGESAPNAQHASDGLTNAVHENATTEATA